MDSHRVLRHLHDNISVLITHLVHTRCREVHCHSCGLLNETVLEALSLTALFLRYKLDNICVVPATSLHCYYGLHTLKSNRRRYDKTSTNIHHVVREQHILTIALDLIAQIQTASLNIRRHCHSSSTVLHHRYYSSILT